MQDYLEQLYEFAVPSNGVNALKTPRYLMDMFYHVHDRNSDTLVITVGDSWTWGGGLEESQRLDQVYGKHISDVLASSWINAGASGWGNSWILNQCDYIVSMLKDQLQYKKIYLIVTLTENGRDIKCGYERPYDYNVYKSHQPSKELYDQVLLDCEMEWADRLVSLSNVADSRYTIFVGKNFVWHEHLYQKLKKYNVYVADSNWIEVLARFQNMDLPFRANLVSSFTLDNVYEINNLLEIRDDREFKNWCVLQIENGLKVTDWLERSPMNLKQHTKHPNAQGHKIWAEYILNCLQLL